MIEFEIDQINQYEEDNKHFFKKKLYCMNTHLLKKKEF